MGISNKRQGSISNTRGTFEPKTPTSSNLEPQNLAENVTWVQGGRTWQPFVGGKNSHENFRQARIYNFRDKCVIAHLSLPWSIGWVALSFLVRCSLSSCHGNTWPNLTSTCPRPPKPIHFLKAYDNSYSKMNKVNALRKSPQSMVSHSSQI